MLVEIPPKMSVTNFAGFLKWKISLIIHKRHSNLKYKHGNRSFYYVDTLGKNTKKMAKCINNQLTEDKLHDKLTIREYEGTFKWQQVTISFKYQGLTRPSKGSQ